MNVMKYDFGIIGAGPAGYTFAIRASQLKKKCVVFDENFVGGTCLNIGCIPSKIWINIANFYNEIKTQTSRMGITVKDVKIDWNKVQEFRSSVINKLQNGIKFLFKAYNIDYKDVRVEKVTDSKVYYKEDNLYKFIEAENIIVATGGIPITLKEFDYNEPSTLTYKNCFNLEKLPSSVVIIGGGIIGIELAQVFVNFGVDVYVVELLDTILTGIDKEAVTRVEKKLQQSRVKIVTSSVAEKVRYNKNRVEITIKNLKTNEFTTISADKVVVAVGIKPSNISDVVNCEVTGKGWIKVDENFKTSVNFVYAIGDIIGPPFLAHRASAQAKFLAESLAKNTTVYQTNLIPSVIYTFPEIAYVGNQQNELDNKKIEYKTSKFYYSALGRAVADDKPDGFIKVLSSPDNKEILGVVIVGKNASELISEYTLAMEAKLSLQDIALTVHPHPTYSELVLESAENALGYAIHSLSR